MYGDSFESDGCVNMGSMTGFVRYGDSPQDYVRFLSSVIRSYDTIGEHLRIKGSIMAAWRAALDIDEFSTVNLSDAHTYDIVSAWVKQKNNLLWICLWMDEVTDQL